jgi:type I restriction enzyme, S subunit
VSAWLARRLEDLATIRAGGTPPRGGADSYGGSIPWAKIADLTASGGRLTHTEELITPAAASTFRVTVFPPGTVLLAMYGSIGESAIADVATASNQAIVGIQCGPDLSPDYLDAYLRHIRTYLEDLGRGGTQSNINASHVRSLMIPLPPLDEQRRIATRLREQLAEIDRAKTSLETQRKAIDALPAALLREVFGEVSAA